MTPKKSIDAVGIPALAKAFKGDSSSSGGDGDGMAKVVMLSWAGVTRPSWDKEKKTMFEGCADIPIVRLNQFLGILDIKADSEERLRQSGKFHSNCYCEYGFYVEILDTKFEPTIQGVSYCIFRPTGLNDDWPAGSRPIFSQGDVAVGRINRRDVATILADCNVSPEVTGKTTFEAFSIQGYPQQAPSIATAVGRFHLDSEGPIPLETLSATFSSMQQLLPGETQEAAALAMGQTYEELDAGKTGRLGKRGEENAEAAAPKPQ